MTTDALDVQVAPFERASLPGEWFDLGTSASAFHWLDEMNSLRKIASVLRPGGFWAMWWNLFFDGSRTDEFDRATRILFKDLDRSPAWGLGNRSFALDSDDRVANLVAVGAFEQIQFDSFSWTTVFDTARIRRLYSTFSPIGRLKRRERQRLLDDLSEIANKQFGGEVELRITTPIYTALRGKYASL